MTRESTDPRQPGTPVDQSRASEHVSDLSRGAWRDVLKRTFKEYKADNLTDLAAALTYYGVLAIFPMLIVLISILGFDRALRDTAIDRKSRQGRARSRQGNLH